MKAIAQRVWEEPAVAIGLLVTLALLAGAFLTGSDWAWETIVAVLAPLLSALGIRPFVSPTHGEPLPESSAPVGPGDPMGPPLTRR